MVFDMIEHSVLSNFCAQIGSNRFLVQGGGGNASWKADDILWIKASGTKLRDALAKDIFVPVDLKGIQSAVREGKFDLEIPSLNGIGARPSIETLLHAIIPKKFVLHLHAVEALVHLIDEHAFRRLHKIMPDGINWALVDYFQPGAELAKKVKKTIEQSQQLDVIFLANHGIVLGANAVEELDHLLSITLHSLAKNPQCKPPKFELREYGASSKISDHFQWINNSEIVNLACNLSSLEFCKENWVLYPDQAVFLGSRPRCLSERELMLSDNLSGDFIFVSGKGVLKSRKASDNAFEQLQCYADIIALLESDASPRPLTDSEVDILINWEAEQYRVSQL